MSKVNFWSIFGLIGVLSEKVSEAMADDGKITAEEILSIGSAITLKLDLPMDEKSKDNLELIIAIVEEVGTIVADKKITVNELVTLGEKVCEKLGIDLDKEGFNI
jgi:hypothetical protein